jgi:hypothetical protein
VNGNARTVAPSGGSNVKTAGSTGPNPTSVNRMATAAEPLDRGNTSNASGTLRSASTDTSIRPIRVSEVRGSISST